MSLIELALNFDTLQVLSCHLNVFDLITLASCHPHIFKQAYHHPKSAQLWKQVQLIRLSHQHEEGDVNKKGYNQTRNNKQRIGCVQRAVSLLYDWVPLPRSNLPSHIIYRIDQIGDDEVHQASRCSISINVLPPACRDDPNRIWSHLLQSSLKYVRRVHVVYCPFYEPTTCPNLVSRAFITEQCDCLILSFDSEAKLRYKCKYKHRGHAWNIRNELKDRLGLQDNVQESDLSSRCNIRQLVVDMCFTLDWYQDDNWPRSSSGQPLPFAIEPFPSLESISCWFDNSANVCTIDPLESLQETQLSCLRICFAEARRWHQMCHSPFFSSLRILFLPTSWTELPSDALLHLHRLPQLQHISCVLSYMSQVSHISNIRSLRSLDIECQDGRWMDSKHGEQLISMTHLHELSISGDAPVENYLSSVFDCSPLAHSFPDLRILDISGMLDHPQALYTLFTTLSHLYENCSFTPLFPVLEHLVIPLPYSDEERDYDNVYRWNLLVTQLISRRGADTPIRILPLLHTLWLANPDESDQPLQKYWCELACRQSRSFRVISGEWNQIRNEVKKLRIDWLWQKQHGFLPIG